MTGDWENVRASHSVGEKNHLKDSDRLLDIQSLYVRRLSQCTTREGGWLQGYYEVVSLCKNIMGCIESLVNKPLDRKMPSSWNDKTNIFQLSEYRQKK